MLLSYIFVIILIQLSPIAHIKEVIIDVSIMKKKDKFKSLRGGLSTLSVIQKKEIF